VGLRFLEHLIAQGAYVIVEPEMSSSFAYQNRLSSGERMDRMEVSLTDLGCATSSELLGTTNLRVT
jgi:hypothetical protein